jgi:hypothetical protein
MLVSVVVYVGLLGMLLGALSLLRPLAFLRIRSRRAGAVLLALGLCFAFVAWGLPVHETRTPVLRGGLDRFMPAYQFHEVHRVRIQATRERVYRAIRGVTASEITGLRTLTWIRRMGLRVPESILNPPPHEPVLDLALRTSFLLLSDQPGREIVIGTAVAVPRGWRPTGRPSPEGFRALRAPGFALAAMNFRIDDAGGGACLLTTETRVFSTDAVTARRFAPYWRTIQPGSALIRWAWLDAIRRRAESRTG